MKKYTQLSLAIAVTLISAHFSTQCAGAIPSGLVEYECRDYRNPLWDVSLVAELQNLYLGVADIESDIWYSVAFTQNGAGKLSGSGITTIRVDSSVFSGFIPHASYRVSGAITSRDGVARLRYAATAAATTIISGKRVRVSATGIRTATLNALTGEFSGTYRNIARASGIGGGTDFGLIPLTLADIRDDLGDGSWRLTLNLTSDGANRVTGYANVFPYYGLSSGFVVKGRYNAQTDTSRLILSPIPDMDSEGRPATIALNGSPYRPA